MKQFRFIGNVSALTLLVFAVACGPSLTLTDVNFTEPMESVVSPDASGNVADVQKGIRFNIVPVNNKEHGQGASLPSEVRFIRGPEGYYFLTAQGYNNVYVFKPKARELELHKIIFVSEAGLANPAFNERSPVIQLIDGNVEYRLTKDGLTN